MEVKVERVSPENTEEPRKSANSKPAPERGMEISKQRKNLYEILVNSNATPIRCYGGLGYACSFCADEYPNPADLKQHTIESHKNVSQFMRGIHLCKFLVKLDITNLKCKNCDDILNTLEEFIHHLRDKHNKILYTDIKQQILPFKFETETLRCFMCSNKFHNFKTLLEHMNIHYRNYICEVCDAGFVNKDIMSKHARCHKLGTFACTFCNKIFNTFRKKKAHEGCVHIKSNVRKCRFCEEKFSDYNKKQKHLQEAHGIPREMKCEACDKCYVNQKQLSAHIKRVHLLERRHKCTECDMQFYSPNEMKTHMLKHTGVKEFECFICHKRYGRKRTLQEHIRIHTNDRRYKCDYCEQAFVQKCSLQGHIRTKHGDKE